MKAIKEANIHRLFRAHTFPKGRKFLDRWGGEAARLGWSALDVFGAHPIAPGARYDAAGLVVVIDGGKVIAVRSRATIRAKLSASELTYLRTPRAGVVALWDVLPLGLSPNSRHSEAARANRP